MLYLRRWSNVAQWLENRIAQCVNNESGKWNCDRICEISFRISLYDYFVQSKCQTHTKQTAFMSCNRSILWLHTESAMACVWSYIEETWLRLNLGYVEKLRCHTTKGRCENVREPFISIRYASLFAHKKSIPVITSLEFIDTWRQNMRIHDKRESEHHWPCCVSPVPSMLL